MELFRADRNEMLYNARNTSDGDDYKNFVDVMDVSSLLAVISMYKSSNNFV